MRRVGVFAVVCALLALGATPAVAAGAVPGVAAGATPDAAVDAGGHAAAIQINSTAPDVNGNGESATDTDGDGRYEDVDGDGFTACDDFDVFEDNYNRSEVQNNVDLFDYNEDGTVDFLDAGSLEEEIGGCSDAAANVTYDQGPTVDGGDPATDPDSDGLWEDVNGDGVLNGEDPPVLNDYLDADIVIVNTLLFDFDGDGSIGEGDVTALEDEAGVGNDTTSDTTNETAPDVNGNGESAKDTDGDGLYEDIDGDADTDCEDVDVFREMKDSTEVQNNADLFDFTGDGDVTSTDADTLEEELGGCGGDTTASLDVNGDGNAATDVDGDGLYEDVDGDGVADSQDPETLATYSNSSAVQNNVGKFDFDGDGAVDDGDVDSLSEEVSDTSDTTDRPALSDTGEPVTDPDGDGLYEDANGNGEFECGADVELFRSSADTVAEYPDLFDFDGDGSVSTEEDAAMLREMYDCPASTGTTTTAAGGTATASGTATGTATATANATTDEFERGFFSNNPDSSVPVLGDPSALTMVGIVLSTVGILLELRGG